MVIRFESLHRPSGLDIDAPEAKQTCAEGWQAGQAANRAPQSFMDGRATACDPRDRYGRPIALCRADGRELGASMVREGMVMAGTPKLGHAIST
jgi:endonuclease YncB( thermonuclease family)